MADKFCIDCAHHRKGDFCEAPQNSAPKIDVVTGVFIQKWRWSCCDIHRGNGWLAARLERTCGREGRWFVERENAQ